MQIGIKVRKLRELMGLTQETLAAALKMSQSTYSRYENDTTNWDLDKLAVAARVLGVNMADIISFDDDKLLIHLINQNTSAAGSSPIIGSAPALLADLERQHYEARIATLMEMNALLERENNRLATLLSLQTDYQPSEIFFFYF